MDTVDIFFQKKKKEKKKVHWSCFKGTDYSSSHVDYMRYV